MTLHLQEQNREEEKSGRRLREIQSVGCVFACFGCQSAVVKPCEERWIGKKKTRFDHFLGFQFVTISRHLEKPVSVYPLQIQHRVNVNDSKRNVAEKGEGERKNFQKGSRRLHRRSWKISQVS